MSTTATTFGNRAFIEGLTVEEVGDDDAEAASCVLVCEETSVFELPTKDICAEDYDARGVLRADGVYRKFRDGRFGTCRRPFLNEAGNTISAGHG